MNFQFISKNWSQLTFLLGAIVFGTTFYVESKTMRQEFKDHIGNQKEVDRTLLEQLKQVTEYLNGEDDGVRSDFETADKSAKEFEDLREEKLYYQLMLEIEKNK